MTRPNQLSNKHQSSGFTLLEVLVVMMIVSLVSVVLMQGMSLILNLRDNLGDQMFDLDQTVLKRNLVRQPLQGLYADFDDELNIFSGQPTKISGLTIQPLLRRAGRPIPFSMTIEYDESLRSNTLVYREDQDEPLRIATWEGEPAFFRYIGDETGWADAWPPVGLSSAVIANVITEVRAPQLPELIFLNTGSKQELDYAVNIQTRRNRIPRDPVF